MSDDQFFIPVSAMEMPRFAGMPSFMRLPHLEMGSPRIDEVEMGLVGVPWDAGTTNRPGPRHGPRQLRDLSTICLLYTSPSPRDMRRSRMPSSA